MSIKGIEIGNYDAVNEASKKEDLKNAIDLANFNDKESLTENWARASDSDLENSDIPTITAEKVKKIIKLKGEIRKNTTAQIENLKKEILEQAA